MEEEKRHAMSPKEVIEFSTTPSRPSTTSGRLETLSKRMMLIAKSDRQVCRRVKRKVNENGNKSYTKLAAEMGCSKQTIANTINKDLGYSSYKKRTSSTTGAGLVPPSSPDCNPLDYFFWGMVENMTSKHAHNTLDSLRATIVEEFANMKKDVVAKACGRFRHRLEMVVTADGGYIENEYL
ncbi:Uncharacterized protein FKW44_014636 [Caligus rogercresseyi]|uniref:Transposase n=1 Tax=Caligus rogercresseyi TaxID=217165 RepID=A0A7T8GZ56_CALRO|nr:Uncharacterized protein FKW44_014636 [Caligus rogercresseyi]